MSDVSEYGMRNTGKPTPPLEETRRYPDALATSVDAIGPDEVVTGELPVVDRAQLPNRIEIGASSVSSRFSLPGGDGISIVDQSTWLLPAVPGPRAAGNYAAENGKTGSDTQGYLSLALDMIKSSGIYALGALASPLVSLVLTPFLTHHLSSTNFGGLVVLYAVIDLVTVITQLGLVPAFFRAYNGDYESPRDRSGVLSASVIILLLASVPVAIAMMITAPWLSEFLFDSPSFSGAVRLTALVIILENLTVPGISWLRAEKRAMLYSALSIANLLLVLGTTVVLVGVLHMGVNGALLAKGVGYAAIVVCTLPIMILFLVRRQSLHLRSDIVRNLLLFGVPTIFSDTAAWVLGLSDRYLLSHFGSLAQTAIYSVAYTLGGVLSTLILGPFLLAWSPLMYTIANRKDAVYVFRLIFHWFSIVLLFAAFAFSLMSTVLLDILFPPAYRSAALIIPIIALSSMFYGIYYIFKIGIYLRRKTKFEILFMSIAASVNLLINLFLIPRFGAMGAAVSTLLAYIVLILVAYIVNQRIYPIRFEIGLFMIELFVGVALYVGSRLLAHTQKPAISWSISIGTLILYGVFLMVLGGLSAQGLKKTFWYVQGALRGRKRMHNRVRMYISACFYYSGVVNLIRWWAQRSEQRLIILYYHQAAGGDLRSHLLYLRRHYRILHLEAALEELRMPHKKEVQRKDRRTLLALTFDDGYYDNYTHAFPLACELHIPITIFLIPGYMECGNSFWWTTRLIRLAGVERVRLEGRTYHLDQQEEGKALAQTIDDRFSHATSSTEREESLASLHQILAVPSSVLLKETPTPLLTWTQVREMQESGWVSFGAHTTHHPDLGNLADPAEVQREVGGCRTALERQLGHPVHIFAYPFGHIGDDGLRAVKQAGYDWAVTIIPGVNTRRSDPHLLRRRSMDVNKHWLVVAAETAGIWGFFSRLRSDARLLIRKCLCLLPWKT